jgi:diguanylate cyclase (GGDEF)-like protein
MDEILVKDFYRDAQIHYKKGNFATALELLQKAHEAELQMKGSSNLPVDYDILFLTGQVYYSLGELEQAKRVFSNLITREPKDDENKEEMIEQVKLYLAFVYFYLGKNTGSVEVANSLVSEILKRNKTNIYALELLGDIHYYNKDYPAALDTYLRIQKAVDDINRILLKLAYCYYFLGESAEAATICDSLYAVPELRADADFKQLYDAIQEKNKQRFAEENPHLNVFQLLFLRLFDRQITKSLTKDVQHERRMNLMKRKLYTDVLTGANNRVCFEERIIPKFEQKEPVTLMMFDIDKFKSVNDTYGHDVGDMVLKKYVEIAKEVFSNDFYRIGGEEFIGIYYGSKEEALLVAEKFRKLVGAELSTRVNADKNLSLHRITCSGGIAEHPKETVGYEQTAKLADNRLYYAKEHGRNQVISEGQGLEEKDETKKLSTTIEQVNKEVNN